MTPGSEKAPKLSTLKEATPDEKRAVAVKTVIERLKNIPGGSERQKSIGSSATKAMIAEGEKGKISLETKSSQSAADKASEAQKDAMQAEKTEEKPFLEMNPVEQVQARKKAFEDLGMAADEGKKALEGAEQKQAGVTSAAEALRALDDKPTATPEEKNKVREDLLNAQKDLAKARQESRQKAEKELEAAKKAKETALEEDKEKIRLQVESAKKKLEDATEAEVQALAGITSDIEQMQQQIQDNPEQKEQFTESLQQLLERANNLASSPSRNMTPGNPKLGEKLGAGSVEGMIGAAGEFAKARPQLPYRWGGGHGGESYNQCMQKGMDCSGLVRQSLAKSGVIPSKTAPDGSIIPTVEFTARDFQAVAKAKPLNQMKIGRMKTPEEYKEGDVQGHENKELDPNEVRRGSLMFWRSPATHVAIVLEPPQSDGTVQILDSSGGRGPMFRKVKIVEHHSFGNLSRLT